MLEGKEVEYGYWLARSWWARAGNGIEGGFYFLSFQVDNGTNLNLSWGVYQEKFTPSVQNLLTYPIHLAYSP